jgi:hypothetical protein
MDINLASFYSLSINFVFNLFSDIALKLTNLNYEPLLSFKKTYTKPIQINRKTEIFVFQNNQP